MASVKPIPSPSPTRVLNASVNCEHVTTLFRVVGPSRPCATARLTALNFGEGGIGRTDVSGVTFTLTINIYAYPQDFKLVLSAMTT
jgi:hypothetical protein